MQPLRTREQILNAERTLLRVLCQGTFDDEVREDIRRLLEPRSWQAAEHQLIFETLREVKTTDPPLIREELLRRLTRKGFPDVDVESLFVPHDLSTVEAMALARALCAGARSSRRPGAGAH